VRPLLVPVTVTRYEPAVPEHDSDDVALEVALLRGRLVGVALHAIPVKGEKVSERATVPAKPSSPVATIVVEPVDPARAVKLVGLTDRTKSWMV